MYIERKQDLSVLTWLKTSFTAAPFVSIVDGFPTEELTLPVIALETDFMSLTPYELGNKNRLETRRWTVDVFAMSKAQRDEFGYKIMHELEDPIPVYDYDLGFTSPPQIGTLLPNIIEMRIVRVLPELTEAMYYRSMVLFTTEYSQLV
jgi:hypothetical protein